MDRENEDSWPHIDLLEFIRPAILAMLFFMSLADGFRQPGLIIHVLNGQARFMVSARLLFLLFCVYLLISLFRNGSTTSSCTRRLSNDIPDWVHEFRQWHVDMFAVLTESQQTRVHLGGNWIVFPYAEFDRLDSNFLVPVDPILVPLPPHLRDIVSQFSSAIVDRVQDTPESQDQTAGPSSMPAYRTRSRTRGVSTGKSQFFHLSF